MKREELRFFDPRARVAVRENRLPHWHQHGAAYFVTFRLADALPKALLDSWSEERFAWMHFHPKPWSEKDEREYHERFTATMDRWLDAGHGTCRLRQPECSRLVGETLGHFASVRYDLISWVVMPNHVHVLLALREEWSLDNLIHSLKRFSARRLNEFAGSSGRVWQRDYFDRLVRDAAHFGRCVHYIRNNPSKAKLPVGEYLLWESDLAQQIA